MNPFDYFMQLSKAMRMTMVICVTVILVSFMALTYFSGYWGDLLAWILGGGK